MKRVYEIIAALVVTILFICLLFSILKDRAMEQTILRLLYYPTGDAIDEYYGERRQHMGEKVISVRQVPDTPYYEVIIQVRTFVGPHNPPYGLETMTFYVTYGQVGLKEFEHQDG